MFPSVFRKNASIGTLSRKIFFPFCIMKPPAALVGRSFGASSIIKKFSVEIGIAVAI
jgi:hypothetical protein